MKAASALLSILFILSGLLPWAPAVTADPPPGGWDQWQTTSGGDWSVTYNLSWDYGLLLLADATPPELPEGVGAAVPWFQSRAPYNPESITHRLDPESTAYRLPLGANHITYNRGGRYWYSSEDIRNTELRWIDSEGRNVSRVSYGVKTSPGGLHLWQEKVFNIHTTDGPNDTIVVIPGSWNRVDYWLNSTPPLFKARVSHYIDGSPNSRVTTTLPLRLAFPAGQPYRPSPDGWQLVVRESNATLPAGAVAGLLAQGRGLVVESDRPAIAYWLYDRDGEWLGPPEGDYYWPPYLNNESLAGQPTALWLLASFEPEDWEKLDTRFYRISFDVTLRTDLPDLQLEPVSLPAPLWEERPVTVNLAVTNRGTGDSQPTELLVRWGREGFASFPVPLLIPQAKYRVALNFTPRLGDQWLNLTVDPQNRVLENDESNNRRAVALSVQARLADLTIDMTISHHSLLPNQEATVTLTVANQGNRKAVGAVVVLLLEGDVTANWTVDLDPSEEVTLTHRFSLEPGTYALMAVVDPGDLIEEFDETNNAVEGTLRVVPAAMTTPSFALGWAQLVLAALVVALFGARKAAGVREED